MVARGVLADHEATAERRWVVRVCARLSGDAQTAEDLAQEVLLRAHRSREHQSVPGRRQAWLEGIARHVCLDWLRQRRRRPEVALGLPPPERPDAFDVDEELDRREIVALLDRAMARLPEHTRAALVDHYVHDLPQPQIALRQGWTPGAVAMRLQRGRETLRDLLLTDFHQDATELGLVDPGAGPGWRPTRLWCDSCGARRLRGRFHPGWGIHLECPDCTRGEAVLLHIEGQTPFGDLTAAELFAGVQGIRRAVGRVAVAFHALLGKGLPGVTVPCPRCGHGAPLGVGGPYGDVEILCPSCGMHPGLTGIGGVAHSHPAMARFKRAHPRTRGRRPRFLEAAGTRAVLLGLDSATSTDRIEFLYAHASMALLGVWGDTPATASPWPRDLASPPAIPCE